MATLGNPPDLNRLDTFFWSAEEKEIIRVLRPKLEQMALEGAETAFRLIPVAFDWALVADDAAAWAAEHAALEVARIGATTQRAIRRKLQTFIETPGMTIGDLTGEIGAIPSTIMDELTNSLKPMFSKVRAEAIAVTEVTQAYAEGERLSAARSREQGLEIEHIWHTNRDDLVCNLCGPLDGLPQSEWESASPGTDYPPRHVRCRCWIGSRWKAVQ